MKALSFRQPWLWAVLRAGKRIDNRKWNTHYRGPILLHASLSYNLAECATAIDWIRNTFGLDAIESWPGIRDYDKASAVDDGKRTAARGGIVGCATIVDVLKPSNNAQRLFGEGVTLDRRWWWPDYYGLVLENVEPLPFVRWPGALGLFEVPDNYADMPAPPGRIARGIV